MKTSMILLVGALVVAGGSMFWYSATRPSASNLPQGSQSSAPVAGAPIVSVKIPAELSANASLGKRGFEAKCAVCHGANAAGQEGIAPPLVHKIYEPGHHGDQSFVRAARNGVQSHHWSFGNMPKIKGVTDADVKYIAAYIRELQRANGIN